MGFLDAAIGLIVSIFQVIWPIASTIVFIIGVIVSTIKAWPFIRRVFRLVDTLAVLPDDLKALQEATDRQGTVLSEVAEKQAALNTKLDTHIEVADSKTELWDGVLDEVRESIAKIDKFEGELTHNGGSSMKDQLARMEIRQAGARILPGETLEAAVTRVRNAGLSQEQGGWPAI